VLTYRGARLFTVRPDLVVLTATAPPSPWPFLFAFSKAAMGLIETRGRFDSPQPPSPTGRNEGEGLEEQC